MKPGLAVAVLVVGLLAVGLAAPALAQAPTGDRAVGYGVIGFPHEPDGRNLWFYFNATSGPNFEDPAGTARIQFGEENALFAEGTVDFLAVDRKVADIRVRVDQTNAGIDFLCLRAVDHGTRDSFGITLLTGTGACPFEIGTYPRADTFAVIDVIDRRR